MDGSWDDIIPDEFDPRNLCEDQPFDNAKQLLISEGFKPIAFKAVIYALFLDDICQYIGSSMHLYIRLGQHIKENRFKFNRILIKLVHKDNLLETERYFISMIEPPYNIEYTSKPKHKMSKEELKNEVAKQRKLVGL